MSCGIPSLPSGSVRTHGLQGFFGHCRRHLRRDEAGRNGVHANLMPSQFSRPDTGHANNPCLACDVVGLTKVSVEADHTRCIENHSTAAANHVWHDRSRTSKYAAQVHRHERVKLLIAHEARDLTVPYFDELPIF